MSQRFIAGERYEKLELSIDLTHTLIEMFSLHHTRTHKLTDWEKSFFFFLSFVSTHKHESQVQAQHTDNTTQQHTSNQQMN